MNQNYKIYSNNIPVILIAGEEFIPNEPDTLVVNLEDIPEGELPEYIARNVENYKTIFLSSESLEKEQLFEEMKKYFDFIEAAGGMILDEQERLLMIFRKGKWDLPKGKIDTGEDAETAAVREIEEETGVKVNRVVKPLLPTYHIYMEKGDYKLKKVLWFLMRANSSATLKPQHEEEIVSVEWVEQEQLGEYLKNTYPTILDTIISVYPQLQK